MILSLLLNPLFIIPLLGLIILSLFLVMSIAPGLFYFQLINYAIGIVLFFIVSNIDFDVWKKAKWYIYMISIITLLLSLISADIRGAHRWVGIGTYGFQPSEILKPFIILFFSFYISEENLNKISSIIRILLLFFPIVLIIFKQPDLGNVIVYFLILISMLIIGGMKIRYLLFGILVFLVTIPLFWVFMHSYQRSRIISFINPYIDPAGAGYNALQSVISIGSGKITGTGLGRGSQSKLQFLPEYHTDFIFASLAEELGLLGSVCILIFYLLLLINIIKIAYENTDSVFRIYSIGLFIQLFSQIFINIGMNVGILPITGITLPLVSYGGSSIISIFMSLGILYSRNIKNDENPLVIR